MFNRIVSFFKPKRIKNDSELDLIRKSFSSEFYKLNHADMNSAEVDYALHYHLYGWKEGRDPTDWFSTNDYLMMYPDVKAANVNPFVHYLTHGKSEGRLPKVVRYAKEKSIVKNYFDVEFYKRFYELEGDAEEVVEHYLKDGWKLGYNPNQWFVTKDYQSFNPDVKNSHVNPFIHYLQFGREEGRACSVKQLVNDVMLQKRFIYPYFDEDYYIVNNQEVFNSKDINPLEHYLIKGWKEGRNPCSWFLPSKNTELSDGDLTCAPFILYLIKSFDAFLNQKSNQYDDIYACIKDGFDADYYLRTYDDIKQGGINPLDHFIAYGWKEGRNPCGWFSTKQYRAMYPDVKALNINPFYHYLKKGVHEKRLIKGLRESVGNNQYRLYKQKGAPLCGDQSVLGYTKQYSSNKQPLKTYNDKSLDIHWVIPDFSKGGGGHMTIFRMVRWMELFGHRCTLWIINPTVHKTGDHAYQTIIKNFQTIKANVNILTESSFPIRGDIVVATAWQTVHIVEQLKGFKERFYFIQDYEPSFYGKGALSLLAENTYKKNLAAICASPWLKGIVENNYHGWARSFMLAYDHSIYNTGLPHSKKSKKRSKKKIAVYSRVTTERRAVELIFAGLDLLGMQRDDFEVHLFGSNHDFDAAPYDCVVHGVLSAEELADLYRDSDLGICFSATNYSLVPQEMMACGLPLLELDGESTKSIFPAGVVALTKPEPVDIAKSINCLLDDKGIRDKLKEEALNWVQSFSWEASARDVEAAFLERLSGWKRKSQQDKSLKAIIIIPTYNAGKLFTENVLPAIKQQRAPWNYEILVIDSSSSDGSEKILSEDSQIRFISIAKKDFQHGRTRNFGVENANSEYIVFLTQDAIPNDEFWLYNMVTILEHYPDAAGAFGRHIAHDDAGFYTKKDLNAHFENFDQLPLSVSKYTSFEQYNNDVSWRQKLHYFSDNSSCLRKSAWKEIPYRNIKYGEDQVWASDIIDAGYSKVYAISSVVKHSHDYSPEQVYERSKIDADYFNYFWGYELLSEDKFKDVFLGMSQNIEMIGIKHKLTKPQVANEIRLLEMKLKGYLDGGRVSQSLFDEKNDKTSSF